MKSKKIFYYITVNLSDFQQGQERAKELISILDQGGKIVSAVASSAGAIHYIVKTKQS